MSTERPTQTNPPNSPKHEGHVHHIDDPLEPRPGPDHPASVDSSSPAEKARRDWDTPSDD